MRLSLALLLALVVAAILAAQAPPAPQQPTFRAAVNFVRVDVYPTIDGRPVADLSKPDFELLEDGVPQALDSFEHVVVRPRDIADERVEPRDLRESNQMAADARNRLFVLFLDTYHVTDPSSVYTFQMRNPGSTTERRPADAKPGGPAAIDRALINFLDRAIGPNDLFAAMTPEMDVGQLTFTRRPENFQALVKTIWGRRFAWNDLDPEEERWALCYPPDYCGNCWPGILQEMVERRREALTLDGLRRVVDRLGELREERKAVLLVSEGWALYRPDPHLARPLAWYPIPDVECGCPVVIPKGKGIFIGPDGKPALGKDPREGPSIDHQQCDTDRTVLAHVDNEPKYRALLDAANRTNTSFYPVDPRGLAVFDTPLDYTDLAYTPANQALKPVTVGQDAASLTKHLEALRSLATATDGRMADQTNDLKGALKKIADDLSDYYLLGYYSTNTKTDGTFRKITVRVKRPGIAVRARRGYLAMTDAEAAARRAEAPTDPEVAARDRALGVLGGVRSDRPFHVAAGLGWQSAGDAPAGRPVLWIAGEIDMAAARDPAWSAGVAATITVTSADGTAATEQVRMSGADRASIRQLAQPLGAGEYVVRVRARGVEGSGAEASEQVRVTVPDAASVAAMLTGTAVVSRRGPFTGPTFQPTADLRFRRSERIRLDVPLAAVVDAVSARLLDRKGQPLPVPVSSAVREENGWRLASGEASLAPLVAADYLLEIAVRHGDRHEKVLAAFRIVP